MKTFLISPQLGLREQTISTNSMSNQQDLIVINILFFVRIVKLWNELSGDIVEADSFKHFTSKLKIVFKYLIIKVFFIFKGVFLYRVNL